MFLADRRACLVWELAVEVQETVTSVQQKLNYWKADYDSISKALKSISWEDSFQSHSVEGMYRGPYSGIH